MLLLNQVVEYCYSDYQTNKNTCFCAASCGMDCNSCLEKIHFYKASRHYDCRSMINYYVCKYVYRQASEMAVLLRNLPWHQFPYPLRVLSLGCGSCSELYAFLYHRNQLGRCAGLQYVGVDRNYLWQPVHRMIVYKADKYDLELAFKYGDILSLLRTKTKSMAGGHFKPNVLVMQYLLSDMARVMPPDDL
ncbi:MAG: hypothetical protein ACUVTU_10195 [Desulfurispora sp.]|uniref:hypothetical protein n=1 Tax=Desulfurispora sp. TaxID=3014275 RepID=UPI00404ACAC2